MAKYDGRLKAMERHLPRAHFDFEIILGPMEDGTYIVNGRTLTEQEYLAEVDPEDVILLSDDLTDEEQQRNHRIMDRLRNGEEW